MLFHILRDITAIAAVQRVPPQLGVAQRGGNGHSWRVPAHSRARRLHANAQPALQQILRGVRVA